MSVLKTAYSLNSRLKLLTPLIPTCCSQGKLFVPSVSYSTDDYVPPTERVLPGRQRVYEPNYLDKLKPSIQPLELINLKMVGYDYIVLERLQKLLHRYLQVIDIDVVDGYAVRAESKRVQRFAPNSSKSVAEFQLKEYQRVLQLSDVPTTKVGLVFELLQAVTPPGVTCSVSYHTEGDEEIRFIPDLEVKALQQQLDELGGPSKLAMQRERLAKFRK